MNSVLMLETGASGACKVYFTRMGVDGMRLFFLLAVIGTASFGAGNEYTYWSTADQAAKTKQLAAKATPQSPASEQLATYGNHLTMMSYRKGDGEVEIHDKMADVFVVQRGEATLLVGGKASGGKTTGPGEIRGGTIAGGQRQKLLPGDIVHIPAGVPHQLLVPKGSEFSYFILKVERP